MLKLVKLDDDQSKSLLQKSLNAAKSTKNNTELLNATRNAIEKKRFYLKTLQYVTVSFLEDEYLMSLK